MKPKEFDPIETQYHMGPLYTGWHPSPTTKYANWIRDTERKSNFEPLKLKKTWRAKSGTTH